MGYRIQYGPPQKGEPRPGWLSARAVSCIAVVTLALVVLFVLSSPQVTTSVWEFLCPGDPEVTKEAFHTFLDSIKGGDSVGQAVTAFCREIIEGAAA